MHVPYIWAFRTCLPLCKSLASTSMSQKPGNMVYVRYKFMYLLHGNDNIFLITIHSADERIDSSFPVKVEVRNNGSCKWMPPGIYKSTCKIDIQWFPFDDQICMMKFGSWTYTLDALDLQLTSEEGDLSEFTPNGEWILLGELI